MNRSLVLAAAAFVLACAPKPPAKDVSDELPVDAEWFADAPSGTKPPAPRAPEGEICGQVALSADVASARMSDVEGWVFVFAREGSHEGRVAAAAKMKMTRFPQAFCLSKKHSVVPGAALRGSYFLSASLDADGSPELDPGDFDGQVRQPVPVNTRGLVILIDTFR